MTYIDKLAFIDLVDHKILCSLSKGKDTWYIPGGKREGDETDEAALAREVREELSVDVLLDSIRPIGVYEAQAHGKPEGTIVRMTCYSADFQGILAPDNEIAEIKYLGYEDKEITSPVDHLIFDDLHQKGLLK